MHGLLITPADESAWLAERMNSVGASEAAAAIGVCPYVTPVELWQRKTGRSGPIEENEAMKMGKLLEPIVLQLYEERTGRKVVDRQKFVRHPEIHFMTATLDGIADGRGVEAKTCGAWAKEWGDEDSDQVPEPYIIQAHQQMAVDGLEVVDIPLLIGGQRFKLFVVERNEDLIEHLVRSVCNFWECVEEDTPPTWGRKTSGSLAILNPLCRGVAKLDERMIGVIADWENAKHEEACNKKLAEELKVEILDSMGGSEYAELPDGRFLKRFLREETVKPQPARVQTKHYVQIVKGISR